MEFARFGTAAEGANATLTAAMLCNLGRYYPISFTPAFCVDMDDCFENAALALPWCPHKNMSRWTYYQLHSYLHKYRISIALTEFC